MKIEFSVSLKHILVAASLLGAFAVGRTFAAAPAAAPLRYAGQLLSAAGAPLTGVHGVRVRVLDSVQVGSGTEICASATQDLNLTTSAGHFALTLGGCNVKAASALFAEVLVDGAPLPRQEIGTTALALVAEEAFRADSAEVADTATEVVPGAVGLASLAANSVDSGRIIDGSVGASDLAPDSVDGSRVVDGSIGTVDLADTLMSTLQRRLLNPDCGVGGIQSIAADGVVICRAPNRFQTKLISTAIVAPGLRPELGFSGLVAGRSYRVTGNVDMANVGSNETPDFELRLRTQAGQATPDRLVYRGRCGGATAATLVACTLGVNVVFTAGTNEAVIDFIVLNATSSSVLGGGVSSLTLEELNDTVSTTSF